MAKDTVVLMGVGEMGATEGPLETYPDLVRPIFATADIRFAQCERLYSERGRLVLPGAEDKRAHPRKAAILKDCGYDVVSAANNHSGDWGEEVIVDTVEVIRKLGIQTIGAGKNLREARKPAILERNGVKIAFLGYLSVCREGYEATHDRGGAVPLRAHTYYEPLDHNPGMPPKVRSFPYPDDLALMVSDITEAKRMADVVVMSVHWGLHWYEKIMAEYQVTIGHAAIDAGVDLILGHHAHLPKAIEVYRGKVIFHSLGNFITRHPRTPENAAAREKHLGIKFNPEYPLQMFGPGSHRTIIARAEISKEGVKKVSFYPAMINQKCQPEPLRRGDPRFDDVVNNWMWVSEGYGAKFKVESDQVIIENVSI